MLIQKYFNLKRGFSGSRDIVAYNMSNGKMNGVWDYFIDYEGKTHKHSTCLIINVPHGVTNLGELRSD